MASESSVTVSARFVFSVLRLVAAADKPLGVTAISRHLNVPVNKAYRAAVTLVDAGYLSRCPSSGGGFQSGPVAEQLVYAAFQQFRIRAAVAPYLRQIATSADATASLAVRIGWYSVTLALAQSGANVVSRSHRVGQGKALDSDVGGLAILAWLPSDEIREFFSFKSRQRSGPKPSASAHQKRFAVFRRVGFATGLVNNKQFQALGMPLRDAKGYPVASIKVEAPVSRDTPLQTDPRLKEWLKIVSQAEATLKSNTDQFAMPFAFLDSNDIHFAEF
jgi:DNA-binding IclR family transcriptional regulator